MKKNKGLWFSILGGFSIIGIFLCLYILTNLTENVSKEVYENISTNYEKNFKNRVYKKEENFKKILLTISTNNLLVNNIETNNLIETGNEITKYNEEFKKTGFETLNITFYPILNQVNQYRNSVNSIYRRHDPRDCYIL